MNREFITALRALVSATNSLRYNPEIEPNDAAMYEVYVLKVKAWLEEHPEIMGACGNGI